MKHFAVVLAGVVQGDRALFLFEDAAQVIDIRPRRHFGGKGGDVALQ